MPIRRDVEDAITRELMKRRGLRYHFSFGAPVVHGAHDVVVDPAIYHETHQLACELYEIFVNRLDVTRLIIEAYGAFIALTENDRNAAFGALEPKKSGRALRMALLTDETFPKWNSIVDDDKKSSR